jgi:hypothetical protein
MGFPLLQEFSSGVWEDRSRFLDPDDVVKLTTRCPNTLTHMVSRMVNKYVYKTSLKDIMDKYYELFRGKNHTNKTNFFNRTEDSDLD